MQNSKVQVFEYELISNVSYLNKMLFKISKSGSFDVRFVVKRGKPRTSHFTNTVELIMQSTTFFLVNALNIFKFTLHSTTFSLAHQMQLFTFFKSLTFYL